jgi:hypothetical protein
MVFGRREDLNEKALRRVEAFFFKLQAAAKDWIAQGPRRRLV